MTGAAVVFLVAYALPILDAGLPSRARTLCDALAWATWGLFAGDYLVRLTLSADRRRYVTAHPFDLLVVVLPVLRPLRLLRLVSLLTVLNRSAATSLRGRVLTYVAGSATLVVLLGALAVLDAERHSPDANITDFGDAVWWAVTTITTVGYGDLFPTTGAGRLAAVLLMLAGIALIGVITAAFASWLVSSVRETEEQVAAVTSADLRTLTDQVMALTAQVEALAAVRRAPA